MVRKLLIGTLIFAGLFFVALLVDLPVLQFCRDKGLPGDLRKLISLGEVFAHGLGVACILLTVLVLDYGRRRWLPRVVACAFGAGLASNILKLSIARSRPRQLEFDSIWDSFVGWFPPLTLHPLDEALDSSIQSFPSSHTATAVGLAIGLGWMYPQGRWLFFAFAAIAAFQRVECGAHFVSDTMAGAAAGCLACLLCFHPRLLGGTFDRLESKRLPD